MEKFGASATRQYTTGGWVGETYLGFSRVMLLLYSHFSTLCPNELHLPVMERLLQSLFAVMSRLFTLTPVCIGEIDDHIKLFLSCCHDFSLFHRKDLFWCSKSNFVSLLNLPDQIDYFGALRLHWEGDREHFVQTPKRHLKTMRRTETFLQSKLGYLHKLANLNNILESLSSNEHRITYQKHSSLHKMFEADLGNPNNIPLGGKGLGRRHGCNATDWMGGMGDQLSMAVICSRWYF